jgi:hypothetical protein
MSRGLLGQQAPANAGGQAQPDSGNAIASIESGGNYGALGPQTKTGDRAYGKYQVMGANIPEWTKETLGQPMTPQQFLANPQAQDAVFQKKFGQYAQAYGPEGAARAWFAGEGNMNNPNAKDQLGTTVAQYAQKFNNATGGQGQYSAYQHNPWANPNEQNLARGLVTPAPATDITGRPGFISPMAGATTTPTSPQFQTGVNRNLSITTPGASAQTQYAVPSSEALGPGGMGAAANQAMDVATSLGQRGAAAKSGQDIISNDMQLAGAAIPIMQNLDLMGNEISKHGEHMAFGPSAPWLVDFKKILAQHAPGLLSSEDIQGLAAQDNLRKMTALLSTAIGRQTGNTDLSLLQGRESVPGEHNSKEGAMAIIDMLKQQVGLNARFVLQNQSQYGQPGYNPLLAKSEFYKNNPIINPLTKNPISVDLAKGEKVAPSQGGGGWSIIR